MHAGAYVVKKTKVGPLINNSDLKLPNGWYSKKHKKVFKNISVFRPRQRAKVSKNTIFLIKMMVFLLQLFICNYQTHLQYTVGKSSLIKARYKCKLYCEDFIISMGKY